MVPVVLSLLFAFTSTVAVAQGAAADASDAATAKSVTAVPWFDGSYNGALSAARKQKSEVILVFAPEWSSYSEKLRSETLQDAGVIAALQSSVCLDVDPDSPLGAQVVQLHNVDTFPTLAFLTSKGSAEDRIVGFIPAQALVRELARIRAGDFTVSALRAQQKAAPGDLTLRNDLAEKLMWVGDRRRAGKLFDSIRRDDPQGTSLASARLAMQDVIDVISMDGGGPTLLAEWDLAPLKECILSLENVVGRAEGWNRLAALERQAGRPDQAIAAWRLAWGELPASNVVNWTQQTVNAIFEARAGLDQGSKAFALEIAEAALASDQAAAERDEAAGVVLDEDGQIAADQRRATLLDALAFAHIINGDVDSAVSLAEQALALVPENEEYQRRAAFFLAGV